MEGQLLVPCTGGSTGDGVTWLWSSIVPGDSCAYGILQIGVGKAVGGSEKWYYAWGRCQSETGCQNYADRPPGATELGPFDGQSHAYRIVIDTQTPYWDFQIDGATQFQISTPQICWQANALYMFGEKYEYGSELGGSAANPQTISNVRWHLDGSTNLHVPSWTVGADCYNKGIRPPDWCQNSSSDALDIWSVFP